MSISSLEDRISLISSSESSIVIESILQSWILKLFEDFYSQSWQSWRHVGSLFLTGAQEHPSDFYIQKRNGVFKRNGVCRLQVLRRNGINPVVL
jgi:hypothetical protein